MKNILFLADDRSDLLAVYQYTLRLANRFQAVIHPVYIFTLPTISSDENIEENDWSLSKEYEQRENFLNNFLEENTPEQSLSLIGESFCSSESQVKYAAEAVKILKLDLVVMGMNQQSKLESALFGNQTLRMIEEVECPLLLIPRKLPPSAIKNIVFASDFKKYDSSTVRLLLEWSQTFHSKLQVLHVTKSNSDLVLASQYKKELENSFRKEQIAEKISFTLLGENAKKGIEEYTENADLMVLGTQIRSTWKRFLAPNMTTDLIRKIEIPVLILKSKDVD